MMVFIQMNIYMFTWNTPATIISAFYKAQINIVNTYKEKKRMWILSPIAITRQLRVYPQRQRPDSSQASSTEYIKQVIKMVLFKFGEQICMTFTYYYNESSKHFEKKLLDDSDNLTNLTSLGMYMMVQRYDNNEVQVDISKIDFYDLITTSL